jgi:hypothetical protein
LLAVQECEAVERRMAAAVAAWNLELVRELAPLVNTKRTLRRLVERTA